MPQPYGNVTGQGIEDHQNQIENVARKVQHPNEGIALFEKESEIGDQANEGAV